MSRYVFDIETNGLLEELTLIHTIHLVDLDTKVFQRFDNRTGLDYTEIDVALDLLAGAEMLVGHNIIAFDIPAIQKIRPEFKVSPTWHDRLAGPNTYDTLVASKVLYPDMVGADFSKFRRKGVPEYLMGRHSLESWGYRMGQYKGDYGKDAQGNSIEGCWSTWNQEMSDYCEQDIRVNANAYMHLERQREAQDIDLSVIHMECDVQHIIQEQCRYGVYMDADKVQALAQEIAGRKAELEVDLAKTMRPIEQLKEYVCKGNNSKAKWIRPVKLKNVVDQKSLKQFEINKGYRTVPMQGYTKGETYWRVKEVPFNPTSRAHIIWNLKTKYGWKPTEFTDGGSPKMDEKTMKVLPYPEAPLLAEIFMLGKRLGQLTDGNKAWMKYYNPETKRIYPKINTMGTISSRMSHNSPNAGQVPNSSKPYGIECRECWGVDTGRAQVGCDASGIQLRMLGHYLARYDGGEYVTQILEGDIHTFNQEKAGLPTRDNAKTFIYGWLFGAGAEKIGKIVSKGKKVGQELKDRFMQELPAVKNLMDAVGRVVKAKRQIRALDGRVIPIRSDHSALNFLLQSAEAVLMKKALVIAYCNMRHLDARFILNVHDEVQLDCDPAIAEEAGEIVRQAIIEAGEFFELRCPMDGEYKVGTNWSHCH